MLWKERRGGGGVFGCEDPSLGFRFGFRFWGVGVQGLGFWSWGLRVLGFRA